MIHFWAIFCFLKHSNIFLLMLFLWMLTPLFSPFILRTGRVGLWFHEQGQTVLVSQFCLLPLLTWGSHGQFPYQVTLFPHHHTFICPWWNNTSLTGRSICVFLPVLGPFLKEATMFAIGMPFASRGNSPSMLLYCLQLLTFCFTLQWWVAEECLLIHPLTIFLK